MSTLTFSVIIPTYKRLDRLKNCLMSVINQTYPKDQYEILVVEDGSHSGADELVNKLAQENPDLTIKYFWRENAGPAAARNIGIKNATGEICAFTDDDCTVPNDWLARLADGFERHPQVVGVGGRMEPLENLAKTNPFAAYELYLTHKVFNLSPEREEFIAGIDSPIGAANNIAYRTKVLHEVGGFDESFKPYIPGEERNLKERICQLGYNKILYIPNKVTHHRDYDWKDFISYSYTAGIGHKIYIEQHGGKVNTFGLVRHLIVHTFLLPLKLIIRPNIITLLRYLNMVFATWAQIIPEKISEKTGVRI